MTDYTVAFKAPTWTWYVSGLYSFDGTNEITESKEHRNIILPYAGRAAARGGTSINGK